MGARGYNFKMIFSDFFSKIMISAEVWFTRNPDESRWLLVVKDELVQDSLRYS